MVYSGGEEGVILQAVKAACGKLVDCYEAAQEGSG
jgi:hypothetical protein